MSRISAVVLGASDSESLHVFVQEMAEGYVEVGREEAARDVISNYALRLRNDTPSKITWYSTLARIEWLLGNYEDAIRHGRHGVSLKTASSIDTRADASHTLNLALRDGGHIDEALKYFTREESPDVLLKGDFDKDERGHAFYGNIGRCLFLKGDIDRAMRFYARAWYMLRDEEDATSVENKGWCGIWIAEALMAKKEPSKASLFLSYCRDVWSTRLPMKIVDVMSLAEKISAQSALADIRDASKTVASCNAIIASYFETP